MKAKCPQCGKEVESKFYEKDGLHVFYCNDCKIGGKADTEEKAKKEFLSQPKTEEQPEQKTTTPAPPVENKALTIPKNKDEFDKFSRENKDYLISLSPEFMSLSAKDKMVEKNINYIMRSNFKKAWSSIEGIESIIIARDAAVEIGATLPEMGSIVPFGAVVEFIPALPAYEHALTTGKNPPYSNIRINCLYENDIYEMSRNDGVFHFEITKMGFPRGEIVGVVVQAYDIEAGHDIGEAYDTQALMLKAEKHSASYQYYLKDMSALRKAQGEGKDYIVKWDKKFYEKDITSPYVGADRGKMLEKLAGKSFFAKDMKVRNARAMETERKESEPEVTETKVIDTILDHAVSQVKDAEIVE